LLDQSFGRLNRRLSGLLRLNVVVQLALCDRSFFGQRRIPVHIHFCFAKLCLRLCELCFRLIKQRLERARINLKKNLAFTDKRTFFVRLPDDVSRDLWLNLCVYVAVERRDPFADNWNIFLKNAGNLNLRARRGGRRIGAAATRGY